MKHILFVDSTYPKPYDFDTLAQQAMGGTESSILRTAEILQKQGHQVAICQHARKQVVEQQQITFHSTASCQTETFDHVVVLRKLPQLIQYQQHFPQAQFYLWLHTYKNREFALKRLIKTSKPFTVIGNSKNHQKHLDQCLQAGWLGKLFTLCRAKNIQVKHAYNPIPSFWTELQTTDKNLNQIMFISAPNKGLTQVLAYFQKLKLALPDLKLLVANPGYREDFDERSDGVEFLGALPQKVLLQKVAESLCVFYPQTSFAETFGLIFAEANAVGTAVLAHDIGSAKEILHPNNGLIDGHDINAITEQIKLWQQQLPDVSYRSEFDEAAVYKQWQNILALP
ncbi:glycosyltransferase [Marinicella rhabdoformis]|uniref:glycosyltransferase n=1 Tax=Marinicella rhabdoformis TaxID=2580566 RepID=UPI0015CF9968|nr:glycosyltransferase [Marinicella rhabdoformis]